MQAVEQMEAKEAQLESWLRRRESVFVAFSAGVDSSYLLAIAHRALGDRVTAVTADSPSLARASLAEAAAFCAARGIAHRVIPTTEFSEPAYLANDGQRCYHCKSALLTAMHGLTVALAPVVGPPPTIALGAIADDLADWRPGMRAAAERGAAFPLADLGFTKVEIRARSQALGLPTWNRPAEPCLSSRVPYGEPVTVAGLMMVEQAEAALRFHGFATCRARHHRIGSETQPKGWLCRIEVPDTDLPRLVELRATVVPALKRIGYANVTLDLAGFTSGGFNQLLGA
jgi:pyridinium-3,5-biscarboxylic acid mononucleotide sulfurtransferase